MTKIFYLSVGVILLSGCLTTSKTMFIGSQVDSRYWFNKNNKILVFESVEDEKNLTANNFRNILNQELRNMGYSTVDYTQQADVCLTFKLIDKSVSSGGYNFYIQYIYLTLYTRKDLDIGDKIWEGYGSTEVEIFRKSPELCARKILEQFGSKFYGHVNINLAGWQKQQERKKQIIAKWYDSFSKDFKAKIKRDSFEAVYAKATLSEIETGIDYYKKDHNKFEEDFLKAAKGFLFNDNTVKITNE